MNLEHCTEIYDNHIFYYNNSNVDFHKVPFLAEASEELIVKLLHVTDVISTTRF